MVAIHLYSRPDTVLESPVHYGCQGGSRLRGVRYDTIT